MKLNRIFATAAGVLATTALVLSNVGVATADVLNFTAQATIQTTFEVTQGTADLNCGTFDQSKNDAACDDQTGFLPATFNVKSSGPWSATVANGTASDSLCSNANYIGLTHVSDAAERFCLEIFMDTATYIKTDPTTGEDVSVAADIKNLTENNKAGVYEGSFTITVVAI